MKLDVTNKNYACTVVEVKNLIPLENCDNLQGIPLFGLQAIVSLETKVGDKGIVFPAECQLSLDFTSNNNLHRHSDLNKNQDKSGYLEDNRRVRAIKLRGHRSDALFLSLDSLKYLDIDTSKLKVGDEFDSIDGREICKKYIIKKNTPGQSANKQDRSLRIDSVNFKKHFDTDNFFKQIDTLNPDSVVCITQKVHGTSVRFGWVPVREKESLVSKLLKKFGIITKDTYYYFMVGSRNILKHAKK